MTIEKKAEEFAEQVWQDTPHDWTNVESLKKVIARNVLPLLSRIERLEGMVNGIGKYCSSQLGIEAVDKMYGEGADAICRRVLELLTQQALETEEK